MREKRERIKVAKGETVYERIKMKPYVDKQAAKNLHYKWSKIIAAKLSGKNLVTMLPSEAQELLDDIRKLDKD